MALTKCTKCGFEIDETMKFCPECGEKLFNDVFKKKGKKINSIISIICIVSLISLVCLFIFNNLNNNLNNESLPNNSKESININDIIDKNNTVSNGFDSSVTDLEFEFIDYQQFSKYWFDGVFRCGSDFEPGNYYLLPLFGAGAMYDVMDSPNKFTWSTKQIFKKITVKEGQYVNVAHGAIMIHEDEFNENNLENYGIYLVGRDIQAGDYKVVTKTNRYDTDLYKISGVDGAYQINVDLDSEQIECKELFDSQSYITLENGQYLIITNMKLTKVK